MAELEAFSKDLKEAIEDYKRIYDIQENEQPKRDRSYENTLKSKESSKELKLIVNLCKQIDNGRLARLSGTILVLYALSILANFSRIHEIWIDMMKMRLEKNGVQEVTEDAKKIAELEKAIADFKNNWQPYLERLEKAFKFSDRYLEENR